jgi:O-antigen/teichoic acid export membrane protein
MKILIIPMIFLVVFGDILTIIFFGIEWKMTGYFFQILAIKYFFVFLTQALRGLPITLDRQNYDMVSNIFQIIGCLLGALIGKYLFDNVYISLILMSIFFIIINIIYFAELFKVMKISSGKYISDVLLSISSIIIISFILRYTLKHLGLIELFFGLFNIEV